MENHPLIRCLTRFIAIIGRICSYFSIGIMLLTALIVAMRHVFGFNEFSLLGTTIDTLKLSEIVIYLHCGLFMLASAATLQDNAHVRVDVFYNRFSPKGKTWVDLLGHIAFLWPMCALIIWTSWSFVLRSYQMNEHSAEASGLPYIFILKGMIPVMAVLLLVQSAAQVVIHVSTLLKPTRPHLASQEGQ